MKLPSKFIKLTAIALLLAGAQQMAQAEEIIVSAASSLTDAFKDISQQYQTKYKDAKISLNFGSSGSLMQQLDKGAPADVFASADQATMDQAQQKQLLIDSSRVNFVRNTLVAIVPSDSQLQIKQLTDLTQDKIKRIAIGNPDSVPVGRYSKKVFEKVDLWNDKLNKKFINSQNVRQVLDYVARGEVDTGLVYSTDAKIMPTKVKVVFNVPTEQPIIYPIALIKSSKKTAEAERFIRFVNSDEGHSILVKYGFSKP